MEYIQDVKEDREMIRVIIGHAKTGQKGLKAPMKSFTMVDTSLEQIYEVIFDALNKLRDGKKK